MQSTALRNAVADLTRRANGDLAALWRQVDSAVAAREALADVLPSVVDRYGAAAATLAATWYDDLREKRGIKGSFFADPVDLGASGTDALAGWGVEPLFAEQPDWMAAQTLVAGGLQRRIANFSRATVTQASVADPRAAGWQREGSGGCTNGFCDMLIARGAVYSEAGADFAAHDHCQCSAVPAFVGEPKPVKAYTPTSRTITDADRARVREYIRTH